MWRWLNLRFVNYVSPYIMAEMSMWRQIIISVTSSYRWVRFHSKFTANAHHDSHWNGCFRKHTHWCQGSSFQLFSGLTHLLLPFRQDEIHPTKICPFIPSLDKFLCDTYPQPNRNFIFFLTWQIASSGTYHCFPGSFSMKIFKCPSWRTKWRDRSISPISLK